MNRDQKAELYTVINANRLNGGGLFRFEHSFKVVFREKFVSVSRNSAHLSLSLSPVCNCNKFPSTVPWNQGNFASFLDTRLIL